MKRLVVLTILIVFLMFINSSLYCQENQEQQKSDIAKKIEEYQKKLGEIQQQKRTLSSEIQYSDTQIYLTSLKIQDTENKINNTEKEIETLTTKIQGLDRSLDYLTKRLIERVIKGYKHKAPSILELLFASENADQLINKIKYFKITQENNQKLLVKVQEQKLNFEEQKVLREEKKKELDQLKSTLDNQKADYDNQKIAKQKLLEVTKNDEVTYQALLAKAKAEYQAIIVITSGGGQETKAGNINIGDQIATVISGSSACSSGTHLHFEVVSGNEALNPANYLSNKGVNWDICGWYGCDQQFSFTGSWSWPLNDPVTITQPFGLTAFAQRSGQYPTHTGVDMYSSDLAVRSVQKGTLFKGSYRCGGGYLTYVKAVPDDSGPSTYYLHVIY